MSEKNIVGESMRELSYSELNEIYGGDDSGISPQSTFICSALFSAVGSYLTTAILCKE